MTGLKKEQNKLEQTIRRYRKMVLEMNQKHGGSPKNERSISIKDPTRSSLIIQSSKAIGEQYQEEMSHLARDHTMGETEGVGLNRYDSGEEMDTARQKEQRVGKLVNLVQSSLDSEYSRLSHFGKHN